MHDEPQISPTTIGIVYTPSVSLGCYKDPFRKIALRRGFFIYTGAGSASKFPLKEVMYWPIFPKNPRRRMLGKTTTLCLPEEKDRESILQLLTLRQKILRTA
jgi:hypothetical protein